MIIRRKANGSELNKIAEHFKGYIKIVVDIEREMISAGEDRKVDEEKELLDDGSHKINLWGGGLDLETKEIDYNSMINLRPNQDNPSRDIMSKQIRKRFDKIVRSLLL